MSDRVNTPFTAEHFVAYCLRMVGHPYWYGTCGYKATSSLLSRKTKQYPSHYGSSRTNRYKQDIANQEVVCDCIGGAKGYAWTGGGQAMLDAIGTDKSVPSTYGAHGCPDKGANSMFSYAKNKGCAWGTMATLPEVPGLALTKDGHVGYYIGNGWAVEWQGFAYGCVRTQVSKRPWTHWYALPFIDYGDALQTAPVHTPDTSATEYTLGSRSLEKGAKGTDVKDPAGAAPAAGLLPAEVRRGRQLWRRNALCPEGLPEQGGHQGGRHLRHGDPCRADGGDRRPG